MASQPWNGILRGAVSFGGGTSLCQGQKKYALASDT